MDLQEFIKKFAELFDETDVSEFKADAEFRDFNDWGSMVGLSVIAMIDDEYGVTINVEDFKKAKTIEALFNVVKETKAKSINV